MLAQEETIDLVIPRGGEGLDTVCVGELKDPGIETL